MVAIMLIWLLSPRFTNLALQLLLLAWLTTQRCTLQFDIVRLAWTDPNSNTSLIIVSVEQALPIAKHASEPIFVYSAFASFCSTSLTVEYIGLINLNAQAN